VQAVKQILHLGDTDEILQPTVHLTAILQDTVPPEGDFGRTMSTPLPGAVEPSHPLLSLRVCRRTRPGTWTSHRRDALSLTPAGAG
jgi:hypothetical protein